MSMLGEQPIEQRRITGVTDDEFAGRDASRKPGGQVVERDDVFAVVAELPHDVLPM